MPYAINDDCKLYYETFGSPSDPTLLLVNGLGSQCINYKSEWCEMFVAAGFHVIRFDNRDVGLSTHFTDAPLDEQGAAYSLADMAADAIAVLDAAGIERAHVMGALDGRDDRAATRDPPSRPVADDDVGDVTHRRARVRPADAGGVGAVDHARRFRPRVGRAAPRRRVAPLGQPGVRRRGASGARTPRPPTTAASTRRRRPVSSSRSAPPVRGPTICPASRRRRW